MSLHVIRRPRARSSSAAIFMATAGFASVAAAQVPASGDVARGEERYEAKCGGCHSIEMSRIGPAHRGVVGRRAGVYPGYSYSKQLKASKLVWTPATLDRWLQGPTRLVPGTRMGISVSDAADRRDIIAYLASQPAKAAVAR